MMSAAATYGATDFGSFAEFYGNSPYAAFEQEHRRPSGFDLSIIETRQDALEVVDPAIPEYAFIRVVDCDATGAFDFGNGWRDSDFAPTVVDIQPANQVCQFRLPAMRMRMVCAPVKVMDDLADEHGFGMEQLAVFMDGCRENVRSAQLIDNMWEMSATQGPAGTLGIEGAFLQLLSTMLQQAQNIALPAPRPDDTRIARVIDYVEEHLNEPLSIRDLAGLAHLSSSHF